MRTSTTTNNKPESNLMPKSVQVLTGAYTLALGSLKGTPTYIRITCFVLGSAHLLSAFKRSS